VTQATRQRKPDASTPSAKSAQSADPALFAVTAHLVPQHASIQVVQLGRRVKGRIEMGKPVPVPVRRRRARVDFTAGTHWPEGVAMACVRLAARWLRDIGGLRLVNHRTVCHIPPLLKEGSYTEEELHWAVHAYARRPWNLKHHRWKSLARFFMDCDLVEACLLESLQHRRLAEADARKLTAQREAELEQLEARFIETSRRVAAERHVQRQAELEREAKQRADEWADRVHAERQAFERLPEAVRRAAFERASELYRRQYGGDLDTDDNRFCALLYTYGQVLSRRRRLVDLVGARP